VRKAYSRLYRFRALTCGPPLDNVQMNIGAFFGGDIRFVATCFERNDHFLVALILEFSEFEAFDNYAEDEVSQICSGMDAMEGPGRLSVEQPGSMCFQGGEDCMVDCLPNANDSPVCLADVQTTPTAAVMEPSAAPTTTNPSPTMGPSSGQPVADPTAPPVPVPTAPPVSVSPTKTPTSMPLEMTTMPVFQPVVSPTRRPSRPAKPTVRPSPYSSPHFCKPGSHGYYGIGDCDDPAYLDWNHKYPTIPAVSPSEVASKQPKKPSSGGSYKHEKEKKGSKKDSKASGSHSSFSEDGSYQPRNSRTPEQYGIGASDHYSSSTQYEKSQFGIGYTYAQPRTIGSSNESVNATRSAHDLGGTQEAGSSLNGDGPEEIDQQNYGIGHNKRDGDEEWDEQR
jgi:hypothetical protein